jgi:hypothetical protein
MKEYLQRPGAIRAFFYNPEHSEEPFLINSARANSDHFWLYGSLASLEISNK